MWDSRDEKSPNQQLSFKSIEVLIFNLFFNISEILAHSLVGIMSRIDLGLARPDDDDANERKLTTALDDLIHDELDAASAARAIDDIITKDCQKALAAYNSASEEQKKNDTVAGPAPQGWQQYLYDCLATAAMETPADHSGQDRLVDLLEELGRLPRHTVPALYFEPERIAEKELWVLTRENNYDGFGQWMWERHEGESRLPNGLCCSREAYMLIFSQALSWAGARSRRTRTRRLPTATSPPFLPVSCREERRRFSD